MVEFQMLAALDEQQRRVVLQQARRRRFKRNEIVFHDGDPGDTVHLVVKGHFAIRIATPLGDIATVRVVGPGEHFGELAVLAPGPRAGTVVAYNDAETMSLTRADFAQLRERAPKTDDIITDALVAEVRRQAAALVDALYVPADRRVWRRLLELVRMFQGNGEPVVVPLIQEDLAHLAGTGRPTVNRVLRSGEAQGVVVLARGRVEVIDVAALERLAR